MQRKIVISRSWPPLLLAALLFVSLPALPASGVETRPRDILILHSYHLGQVWTDGVMAGMQEVLAASEENLRLHVEYMDTKRFHDPDYLTQVLEIILTYKLQRLRYDLVLLSDNDALNFVLRHRNDLFADTPVIFCGVNNFQPEMIAGMAEVTGVAEYPNFRATLALALQFHPHTRDIVVIGNTRNETDRQNYRLFLDIVPEFGERVQFHHWDDLPMDDLAARLKELGPGTIVFINGLITDQAGRTIPFKDSNRRIREATDLPLYSAWEFFLGDGIVGGRLVSARRHGELAAQLALRVLRGEEAGSIPVITKETNQFMFDAGQLRRFGIREAALPPGSVIINRPQPFLALSRRDTYYALAIAAGLVGLLTALAVTMVRRRRAEGALRQSEERFRAIADHAYDWNDWTGPDGRLCWVSPSVERHTGFTVADCHAMAEYPLPIVHEADRQEMARIFASALSARTTGNDHPFRIRRKDGEVLWMAVSWHPLYSDQGKYLGSRASIRDITERQQAQEALRAVNEELDAFVATASHDLRSPLTPIIGYAELLRRQFSGVLDETGRWAVEQIEQMGRRMLEMLEDLLALARMECLESPDELVDGGQVLQEVLADLAAEISAAGASVVDRGLPSMKLPRCFLVQALANLIGNAVRYAGCDGPIEVGGECRGSRARIYVRDHGPGIDAREKERIFDPFYRGCAAAHSSGTGIGLATVRRIARRCGGRAWVEDTPGGGSTFWLELETTGCRTAGG